jgi:hypothetical protein
VRAPAIRTFYRVVRNDPPTIEDFLPHGSRRPPPWRNPTPEQLASWSAVSIYVTEEGARDQALAVRQAGRSIGDFKSEAAAMRAVLDAADLHGPEFVETFVLVGYDQGKPRGIASGADLLKLARKRCQATSA